MKGGQEGGVEGTGRGWGDIVQPSPYPASKSLLEVPMLHLHLRVEQCPHVPVP